MKSSAANPTPSGMPSPLPALLRAAKRARALSKATGTPFYVVRQGKIVDLNRPAKRRPASKK